MKPFLPMPAGANLKECPDLLSGHPLFGEGRAVVTKDVAALKKTYPALNWKEGRLLNRADEKGIRAWLDKLGY